MASSQLQGFGKQLGNTGALGKVAAAGLAGVAAAGLGLVAGIGSAIGEAMDFESAMSAVAAVAGGTDADLKRLSDTALQLGQDTTLSGVGATDAARAMRELAAAGMSVDDIVGGGALGALRLASAGGIDVARASEIAAMALANFGLAGSEATRVADLFAAASNSSAIGVDDIAEAMKYVGPIANSMGLSVEEVTATIAAFGNQGIKGSQAGTSFRSMLVSMAKPTKQQAKLMKDLGLEFFDTNGEMKDIAGIAEELKTGMAGLTDQQRAAALATLYGNEALTAATVLYGEGADGINKWIKEITNGATAAEVGAKRNDNLKGAIESLTSSAETALIAFGMGLTPALKGVALGLAGAVSAAIPFITIIGQHLGRALTAAIDGVRVFGSVFAELVKGFASGNFNNAFGPIMAAIGMLFGPETMAKVTLFVSNALTAVQNFRNGIVSGFGAVLGAITSLVAGKTTLAEFIGGMEIFVATVLGNLGRLATEAAPHIGRFFGAIGGLIVAAIPQVLAQLGIWLGAIGTWITTTAIPAIATAAGGLASALGGWITTTAIPFVTTNLPVWGAALWDWITTTAVPTVTGRVVALAAALTDWITTSAIPFLQEKLPAWGAALWDWITNTAVPTVVGRVVGLANALADWVTTSAIPFLNAKLPEWGAALWGYITDTAVPTVQGKVIGLANALSDWIEKEAVPRVRDDMPSLGAAVVAGIAANQKTTNGPAEDWGRNIGKKLGEGMVTGGVAAIGLAVDNWKVVLLAAVGGIPALMGVAANKIGEAFAKALVDGTIKRLVMFEVQVLGVLLRMIAPVVLIGTQIGRGIPEGIWTGIQNNWAKITGFGALLIGALGRIVAMVFPVASAIGNAIIAGISGALSAGAGKLASIASGVVNDALAAAKGVLGIKSPSKEFMIVGNEIVNGLVEGMDEKQQEAAKKAADVASSVAKALTDTLAAARALAGFDFGRNTPSGEQLGWFRHLTESLVATMQDAAKGFEEKGLKAATEFADAAGKVGSAVKNAVDGLLALGKADWATSSPTGSAMGWFTHLIGSLIANFAAAGATFQADALKVAAEFADAAGKVGGSVKNGVEGLKALASADWAESSPSGSAMGWFTHLIASLTQNFATAAKDFDEGALGAASAFADSAGKVVATIGPAVQGFAAMATMAAPSEGAIDSLMAGVRRIVGRFAGMAAEMDAEGIKATGDFAAAAGTALGAAKTGVELFAAMAGDKDKAGNHVPLMPPSAQAIDDLMHAIRYVISKFREMAQSMEQEGIGQMQTFAAAAGQVLAAAKTGTELFKQMEKLAVPAQDAIDYLLGSIGYVISQTRAIATGIGTEGLKEAQSFATGSLNVINTIKQTLETFKQIDALKDIPAKALEDLHKALEPALDFAHKNFLRAEAIKAEAHAFLRSMEEAFHAFTQAQSIANSMGAMEMTAPAGVGGGAAGGGAGGAAGGTVNNYTINTGDVYDGARFEDRVVSALAIADQRGR